MTKRKTTIQNVGRHRITLAVVLCLLGLCGMLHAQISSGNVVPGKRASDRVYLEHADNLHYDRNVNPDAQILDGNVAFSHRGAILYCDSAHFYEARNSFEAFGNVRMYQGDTLSLLSDYALYDGVEQMVIVRHNVELHHKESTLYTDSLNYDRLSDVGYFFDGGRLEDKSAVLTSEWGEYDTRNKLAIFNFDVRLRDTNFLLKSDSLHYSTALSEAHVLGPSDITSGTSRIYSENGYYNSRTEMARLFERSVVRDGAKVITADTLYHDARKGTSEALCNAVYNDTLNRNILKADYCWYDDSTGYAMTTGRAVTVDYSQGDSLFMHADTFKLYTYNINTDSVYRVVHAYNRVRAYRTDVQAVCDSLVFNSKDSCMTMYRDPIVWNFSQQLLGQVIKVYMKDSTINRAHVVDQALSVEQMHDSVHFNQISAKEMLAFFDKGEICEAMAEGNVTVIYHIVDDSDSSFIAQNNMETSRLRMFLENRKMKKIWAPKSDGVMYPMSQIPGDKKYLPSFVWFDYIRPVSKDDIFNWRGKKAGTELKAQKRREAPLQLLGK